MPAISTSNTIPTIIAGAILRNLARVSVYTQRTDRTWQSALNNGGDTVIINTPGSVAVNDYTAGGNLSYSEVDVGTPITLSLNKAKSFALNYDDLNRSRSSIDLLVAGTTEVAEEMSQQIDSDVRAEMVANSTDAGAMSFDMSKNIKFDALGLAKIHRQLDLARVPQTGRWAIVGPYFGQVVQTAALQNDQILASPVRTDLVNGLLGSFGGFTFYKDPLNSTASGNAPNITANETILFGSDTATAYISRLSRQEAIRAESTFADRVRGLYTYGVKVIKPERLFRSAVTVTKLS